MKTILRLLVTVGVVLVLGGLSLQAQCLVKCSSNCKEITDYGYKYPGDNNTYCWVMYSADGTTLTPSCTLCTSPYLCCNGDGTKLCCTAATGTRLYNCGVNDCDLECALDPTSEYQEASCDTVTNKYINSALSNCKNPVSGSCP